MPYLINLLLITAIFCSLTACKSDKAGDYVFDEFSKQLKNQGLIIDHVDETGLIFVRHNTGDTLQISLDNVRRDFDRDGDTQNIAFFALQIAEYTLDTPSNWLADKDSIYVSLFQNYEHFDNVVNKKITDTFSRIFVLYRQHQMHWITKSDIAKWHISLPELQQQANINADRLLAASKIEFDTIEGRLLGTFETHLTSMKGALLFAPSLPKRIKNQLGYPVLAVIPVRDFCFLFAEKDFEFFSSRLGQTVVDEFKNSGYPITTEILKLSDTGVSVVGVYH